MCRTFFLICICLALGRANAQNKPMDQLEKQVRTLFSAQKGVFALAFKDLQTGECLGILEKETFHAASTMKTPVMIALYEQAAKGKFRLTDSLLVTNSFKSIVDGSSYSLDAADDSQQELYHAIGSRKTINDLIYEMIILSSNLATNLLMELVGGTAVTQIMRELGAPDIQVRRGVEDQKAFDLGLNNTTTAYDLMVLFERLAKGEIIDPQKSEEMIRILMDQQWNEIIPAKLPPSIKIAHKTGSIRGVQHDSGIVYLPDGRKYVVVLLSKKLEDEKAAIEAMAAVSGLVYQYMMSRNSN